MIDPAALAPAYSRFLREGRVLLTGHSHQAWPDVARDGLLEAFDDAAAHVDDKWERAMAAADDVRRAIALRIGAEPGEIALGGSTHELVTRLLSALDLRARPHLVTTRGEFHSLRRQLARLEEEGVEITWVDPNPLETLSQRLAAEVRERTAALLVSTVLFQTAAIVPELSIAVRAARAHGAEVLLDAYHAFGVVPFGVGDFGERDVFVTAGGYKYAQWGEGACFMRVPPGCALRPVYTGWFSEFGALAAARDGERVQYGARPADRFAGSTYDPASHYRARAVARFFDGEGLTVERLRALSLAQTERILAGLPALAVRTPREAARRGGFVALEVKGASTIVAALRQQGIFTDARGDILRLGPAPYVTDPEIDRALVALRALAPG